MVYAAVILSFMGAVHWGVAMAGTDQQRGKHFIASVVPALIAWSALLLPQSLALLILLTGFIGLYAYDRSVEDNTVITWLVHPNAHEANCYRGILPGGCISLGRRALIHQ